MYTVKCIMTLSQLITNFCPIKKILSCEPNVQCCTKTVTVILFKKQKEKTSRITKSSSSFFFE